MCRVLVVILLVLLVLTTTGTAFASDEAIAAWVDKNKEAFLQDWLSLVVIPGKSREERQRGEWIQKKFVEIGLENVTMDSIGNVIGTMKGNPGKETVVIDAHMDTVFANDTPLNPEIKDGWLHCPGSGDDTPSVIGLIWLKKGLDALNITPAVNLVFLAAVQEEIGLKGTKHYLANLEKKPDMFIAVDGGSIGSVTAGALGINWYKAFAKTAAGHTMRSLGKPSAVKSLALAITEAYKFQVERDPMVYLNLGVIGGGTTENAIAEEAWVTLDIRSQNAEALSKVENEIFAAMEKAVTESGGEFRKELLMDISAGLLPDAEKHKVVQTALDTVKALGFKDAKVTFAGATDGNAAIAAGIPTVSLSMTKSENGHSVQERTEVESVYVGLKQLLMLITRLQ